MTKPTLLAASVVLSLVAAACASSSPAGTASSARNQALTGPKVRVVATTTQVADFARVIGGDCVDVYGVLKPNVDPHDYEPSPADLDALARADVIVKNGVGLEKWLDDTIASADSNATVVDASTGVALRPGGEGDPDGDPHIWQDPRNAEVMVAGIARALSTSEPSCQATFAANLSDYTGQLQALDQADAATLGALCTKKLVTNHDAFGYYVDRYGLDFVGSVIPSFDSSAELSGRDIARLVDAIRAQGVTAIFSESSLPPKTAQAVADEAGVKVVQGDDALYGDTLGPAGSDGATYLTMVAHNTRTIADNLRCGS